MSVSHHGEESENIKRLMEQFQGTAKRKYPQGRMGHEDDGVLSYAIAADHVHKTVVIRFGKPVEWLGLGVKDAQAMIDKLKEKILELGEPVTITV